MQLNPADHGFLETLCAALPAHLFRQAEPRHLEEPRGRWAGQAAIVAMPETTEQVSAVIAAAHRSRVGVVPFGGGTGLVGGQVKGEGPAPLILSLALLLLCERSHLKFLILVHPEIHSLLTRQLSAPSHPM